MTGPNPNVDWFAPRLGQSAGRLAATDTPAIATLGDGAAWTRNAAAEQLPGSGGMLDIDHASGHISDAGKGLFGEGTAAAKTWRQEARALPLSDGWSGLCDHIGATLLRVPRTVRARGVGGPDGLLRGPCREVVGDADAMASLCNLSYSDHWDLYRASSNGMPESAGTPQSSSRRTSPLTSAHQHLSCSTKGRLAQLARAPARHAGGRRFKSCIAHYQEAIRQSHFFVSCCPMRSPARHTDDGACPDA